MSSRFNLLKNVNKYSKSIKYFKEKMVESGVILKNNPIIKSANEKLSNIQKDQRFIVVQQYGEDKFNQIRSIIYNQKLPFRTDNVKNKIKYYGAEFIVIEIQRKQPPTNAAVALFPMIPFPTKADVALLPMILFPTTPYVLKDKILEPPSTEETVIFPISRVLFWVNLGLRMCIIAQKNGANVNKNYLRQLTALYLKIIKDHQTGNKKNAENYIQEILTVMKRNQLNPSKNSIVPAAQVQLFLSLFVDLLLTVKSPDKNIQDASLSWFSNLASQEQYLVLSVITSLTLWLTSKEVGTGKSKLSPQNIQMMEYVLRFVPLIALYFADASTGTMMSYSMATKFISLNKLEALKKKIVLGIKDFLDKYENRK